MKVIKIVISVIMIISLLSGCELIENVSSGAKSSKMMTKEEHSRNKPEMPVSLFIDSEEWPIVFEKISGVEEGTSSDYQDMLGYLDSLPENEKLKAWNDEIIVIDEGMLLSDDDMMDSLKIKVAQSQRSSLTIVMFDKSQVIVETLLFDGVRFYGIHHDRTDAIDEKDYLEYEFKYMRHIRLEDEDVYVLINNDEWTDEEILSALDHDGSGDKFFNGWVIMRYKR